ncbi:hypothetical protein [Lentibacillus persicus]|nr:hypothetical protein [Lentibacillus persicus]
MIPESIHGQAKKYKKLFESFTVNPNHLTYQDKDFYAVFYRRFNTDTAFAIFSPQDNIQNEEHQVALEQIVILLNNWASIKNKGSLRNNIDMTAFYKTRHFLDNVLKSAVLSQAEEAAYTTCSITINKAIFLQSELNTLMEEYKRFVDMKEADGSKFTVKEIEYIQDILAELDYIQYNQLKSDYDTIDSFQDVKDSISQNEAVNKMAEPDHKKYIEEFARNKDKLKKDLESITYFDDQSTFTKTEHMKAVKNRFVEKQRKELETLKKDLRHPDI